MCTHSDSDQLRSFERDSHVSVQLSSCHVEGRDAEPRQCPEPGQLQEVLNEIYQAQAGGTASMNDSCKRRMSSADVASPPDFELIDSPTGSGGQPKKQAPIVPTKINTAVGKSVKETELPEGISSVEQWGKTVCTLPKVVHRRLSYEEMIHISTTDEEIKNYLKYILTTGVKSAKVDDLRSYMHSIDYKDPDAGKMTYLGTSEVREFK